MAKGKPPEDSDRELVPSDHDMPGVGFLEGVISVFEGFGRNRRVTFAFIEVAREHPCAFCGQYTRLRLTCNREGEQANTTICHDCKSDIANSE